MSNRKAPQADKVSAADVEMTMADAALNYAKKGMHVFPVVLGERKSHKAGKHSNGRNWGATRDEKEIRHDFKKWPDANIGIPTGVENRIFVVDADTVEGHGVDGIASLKALEAKHGKLPPTRMAISPSGSEHYYFRYPTDATIRNSTSDIADGVDIRGEGGMVLAPPSVVPAREATADKPAKRGGVYKWVNQLTIANAPPWLIDLCKDDNIPRTSGGDQSDVDFDDLAAALSYIPNDNLGWEKWNNVGMAMYRATGGSDDGFRVFDRFSAKSPKYNARDTHSAWYRRYRKAPPTKIGAGTIFYLADKASPGWRQAVIDAAFEALARAYAAAAKSKGGRGNA